jgi:hypothetical protein
MAANGPLRCAACHKDVNGNGVPVLAAKIRYKGRGITEDYDLAVQWMHASAPDWGGGMPRIARAGRGEQ